MALVPQNVRDWSSLSKLADITDGRISYFIQKAKLKIELFTLLPFDLNDEYLEMIQFELTQSLIATDEEEVIGGIARNLKSEDDSEYSYQKYDYGKNTTGYIEIDKMLIQWCQKYYAENGHTSTVVIEIL